MEVDTCIRFSYVITASYLSQSVCQAALLLLFNESERLSFSEIVTQLNLSEDDTVRLLHSLSCAKYKILNKEPNSRTISPKDDFEFNHRFTDKMRRIKVPFVVQTGIVYFGSLLLTSSET